MPEKPSVAQPRSLLEQLPDIVRKGNQQAERIIEGLQGRSRIGLLTRELVTPAKDSIEKNLGLRSGVSAGRGSWANRLIYGDNLLAMAALLAGDENTPSLRGGIDLVYIDPPFDSKADYRTKITLPGGDMEQKPTVFEQFAYSDTWADGTASYLAMIVPRLCLMRELLSDRGAIYVHLDWRVGHYVKIILDEIFGKNYFKNDIRWRRQPVRGAKATGHQYARNSESLLFFSKCDAYIWNNAYKDYDSSFVNEKFRPDANGRLFRDSDLGNYSEESIKQFESQGRIYVTKNSKRRLIRYLYE